jgi:ferrochelatase
MVEERESFSRLGVVCLGFGEPGSAKEVKRFLFNVFSDENMLPVRPKTLRVLLAEFLARRRSRRTAQKLEAIGGKSPSTEISFAVAALLEDNLRKVIPDVRVHTAMRYTTPFSEEVLFQAKREGVSHFVVLPLYPQFCRVTTGSAFGAFRKALKKVSPDAQAVFIDSYHNYPGYISAVTGKVKEALDKAGTLRGEAKVIFSAHSIPVSIANSGDPYLAQVSETAASVAQGLGITQYALAFQSAPRRGVWLSPTLKEVIETSAACGFKKALLIPISFTCDNMETLYDIDVVAKGKARRLGIALYRAGCLNTSPEFADSLAQIVISALRERKN